MSLSAGTYERQFLDTFALRWPDKPAVVMSGSEAVLTYHELDQRSNQFAQVLRDAGIGRGGHVAYLLENSGRCFEVMWGAYRAGCYFTPINTRLTAEEAEYIIRDCGAEVFVISATFASVAKQLAHLEPDLKLLLIDGESVSGFQVFSEIVGGAPTSPIDDESAGLRMYYTSGTTGRPKGVERPLPTSPIGSPDAWLQTLANIYGWSENTRYLCPAPLYHGAGLWWTMAMHQIGATAVVMEKFDPEKMLAAVDRNQITCLQAVPTMLSRLLKLPPEVKEKYSIASLTHLIHAAAPCPIPLKEALLDWMGPIIYEYYASTEGNGYCVISPQEWLEKKGSVGRAILGVPHIVGTDGGELTPGEAGVIYFENPGIPFRYHNDDSKTAAAHHPLGWTTVGDIGYLDLDGYLYLTDRQSHMIISGGVNIYPQEAENLLGTHVSVDDVAVIGVPNADFGEEVKAVVKLSVGLTGSPQMELELIEFCRDRLAHYKCPRSVDFVDDLPREENGKLYKRLIREKYWSDHASRIV